MATDLLLPFDGDETLDRRLAARDRAARERAVDPRFNVALEASAGTGKTRVLVDRYINLLRAGVEPRNILAVTFTRKAAAEMRARILAALRGAAERAELPPKRWAELRDRLSDIAISTIDAFCLGLLREFPLEADLDPGFAVADDTELPRLIDESLDRALQRCRSAARADAEMALVFAQLGERRARAGLAALLRRRLAAPRVLAKYLSRAPADTSAAAASHRAAERLLAVFESMRGGFEAFSDSGPLEPAFQLLVATLRQLRDAMHRHGTADPAAVQAAFMRAREHFLTQDGRPRSRSPYPRSSFAGPSDWRTHASLVVGHGDAVARAFAAFRRDLNMLVSRGVHRMYLIAEAEYRRTLDAHAVLDFPDLLLRTLDLLRRMDEFSRSRYRLESRYHHVLVDEFQDTSRAQWELVALLIQSWGEGAGLTDAGPLQPSIFIVGDRKQSIYGFRDADVSVLREAARHIELLRPDRDVRRSMSRSFRAVPPLLAFVNDVCHDMDKAPARPDAFEYEETDRFPIDGGTSGDEHGTLGLVIAETTEACAEAVACEIQRLLAAGETVRDRDTGVRRPVRAADVAILFRSRESHREFEAALVRRGIRTYVYRGLGFFDTDEIKDVLALLWYLADPGSNRRTAALLRSRLFGLSDEALRLLAPSLADALTADVAVPGFDALESRDAASLAEARAATARWRALVDRVPPAELLDVAIRESAYLFELRGPRHRQARENLKKVRALLRRLQNRGYATLTRVAAHLDRLALGDEANAAVDAGDAVHLMTVHASKGLEFPVVFLVNLSKGTGNRSDPVRVSPEAAGDSGSVAVGDFQSDADEERAGREREETKRLLYVALTRARDRLYLSSAVTEDGVTSWRGSFADVMPQALLRHFNVAGRAAAVEWRASSGGLHRFRLCPAADDGPVGEAHQEDMDREPDDFEPFVDTASRARTVSSLVAAATQAGSGPFPGAGTGDTDAVVGRVVHRILQRFGFDDVGDAKLREAALGMIRLAIDGAPPGRPASELGEEAVAACRAIRARADIRALYSAGAALHEVPFTMRLDGGVVRGTIDCLIRIGAGRMALVEFKTGRRRDFHQMQVDMYRRAAEQLFQGETIETFLVYADEPAEG